MSAMAKICPNCHLTYKKYAYKCVSCRTVLEKKKKTPLQIALIVISITLSVCLLSGVTGMLVWKHLTDPATKTHEVMTHIKNGDVDAVMDCLPEFLTQSDVAELEKIEMQIDFNVMKLHEYLYSFNTQKAVTPSGRQMDELIDSIKMTVGEDFDPEVIEDVKMVWVDIRGGLTNFWQTSHMRFTMIKYQGEWCWWPFY